MLKHPRQLTVNFDGDDLLGSRRQKLGHRPPPWADLADQIIGLDRQAIDDSALKPPVAEKMLAKLGTRWLGHGERLYLKNWKSAVFGLDSRFRGNDRWLEWIPIANDTSTGSCLRLTMLGSIL